MTEVLERINRRINAHSTRAAGASTGSAAAEAGSAAAAAASTRNGTTRSASSSRGSRSNGGARAASAAGDGDDSYDVDGARKLLVQAQRRTDRIASASSTNRRQKTKDGGEAAAAAAEGTGGGGILQAAGTWLFGSTEERRHEDLARQVEEQRRRLRKAIKRRTGGTRGTGSAADGTSSPDRRHHRHHRRPSHHYSPGGICSAITGAGTFAADDSSSSSSSSLASAALASGTASEYSSGSVTSQDEAGFEVLVESPVDTESHGFHVDVHIPESTPTTTAATAKNGNGIDNDDEDDDLVMEVVIEQEKGTTTRHVLSPEQMKSVALAVLPPSVRYCRWKRLYSLSRDGDSFEAFLRHVGGWKRTLLVLSTSRGEIFGAYADSPWENQHHSLGATFYGSAQACLWRLEGSGRNEDGNGATSSIAVYKWTGANRYIQLCDSQAKLIAFGGGGDDGDFGLCVEDDFRRGSTGRCETFGNEPLCQQDQFDIVDLECYGFPAGFA